MILQVFSPFSLCPLCQSFYDFAFTQFVIPTGCYRCDKSGIQKI
jgi:hypothetical protein